MSYLKTFAFRAVLAAVSLPFILFSGEALDWSKAKEVQSGVLHLRLERTQPRLMKINVMRVDLRQKGLRFISTRRDPDWGKPMPDYPKTPIRAKRITTADFMRNARKRHAKGGENLNVIVAANAAMWGPWCKPFNHKYSCPSGVNITDGEILSVTKTERATFFVDKQGRPGIVQKLDPEKFPDIHMAVSGPAVLLKDGKITKQSKYEAVLHPRMAYGLDKERRYLYLLTVDGRQEGWSLGADGNDLAELFLEAGASDAINMDGGGSASLCYFDRNTKQPVMVNHHANGVQRKVGSNIGIAIPWPSAN